MLIYHKNCGNIYLFIFYCFLFTILVVGPSSLEIEGPSSPVTAGEYITLICTVEGAKPAANATWFNRSDVLNITPEIQVDMALDGTFTTISTVEVPISRHDHQGTYYCKGTNSVFQSKGEAPLLKSLDIQVLCKCLHYSLYKILFK